MSTIEKALGTLRKKAPAEADHGFVTRNHCKVFHLITLFAVYYLDVSGS